MGPTGTLRKNIKAFRAMEEDLKRDHSGMHALLHDGELVGMFAVKEAARLEAERRFPNGGFAISPVIGAPPESLGAIGLHLASAE